jgi:predicted CoA-substrate-specific enzyme activase
VRSPLFAGIDVGSTVTKVVVLDGKGGIRARAKETTGVDFKGASDAALKAAVVIAGVSESDLSAVVATGYGRHNASRKDLTKTEIACHAKGVFRTFGRSITVIDIGGQDNKIIEVDAKGNVADFKMNRKCAAGTGAFLEDIAHKMTIPLDDMNRLAETADTAIDIGSFCTVFAAATVLAEVKRGAPVPNIVKGVYYSMVKRVTEIGPVEGTVVATGGVVANNPIVPSLLSEVLGREVLVPEAPQFTGALGAAFFAMNSLPSEDKEP